MSILSEFPRALVLAFRRSFPFDRRADLFFPPASSSLSLPSVVIYILNYIDRNNLSAARTKGLEVDLALKGQVRLFDFSPVRPSYKLLTRFSVCLQEYPTLLSILYVGYIIMQIPSNRETSLSSSSFRTFERDES